MMAERISTGQAEIMPGALPEKQSISRRGFMTQFMPIAAASVAAGFWAHNVEPFWPRLHEVSINIRGLPKSFQNFRIAHLTDLHTGHTLYGYLQKAMKLVAAQKPDIVVVTGDLVHHSTRSIDPVVNLLRSFPCPVYASFGNHDYGQYRGDDEDYDPDLSEKLCAALTAANIPVLRNTVMPIRHTDGSLWIVGLDDLWYGDFQPRAAFDAVPAGQAVIALSHNPDTAEMLAPHHPDLILSGHTHGGQVRLPLYGPVRLNIARTLYDLGHFYVGDSQLYVSSGVGYILRMRFNCRPEIPIFKLLCAT